MEIQQNEDACLSFILIMRLIPLSVCQLQSGSAGRVLTLPENAVLFDLLSTKRLDYASERVRAKYAGSDASDHADSGWNSITFNFLIATCADRRGKREARSGSILSAAEVPPTVSREQKVFIVGILQQQHLYHHYCCSRGSPKINAIFVSWSQSINGQCMPNGRHTTIEMRKFLYLNSKV